MPFLQGELKVCRHCHRIHRRDPVHDFVTVEVINDGITGLHRMQDTIGLWSVEERLQLHEMMAAAARIETIKSDGVFPAVSQRLPIGKVHRDDFTIIPATFCFHFEAQ